MRRTPAVSLASAVVAAALLVSAPAHSAVKPKDVPNESAITKVFPELAGGEFTVDKSKEIRVPGGSCETQSTTKAKSAVSVAGASPAGQPLVVAGVAELRSPAKAKKYVASFKKFVKACPSYTDATTGATVTLQLTKAPKLGQSAVAFTQQTSIMGITTHSTSVLVRHDKRIASVVAIDDAPIVKSSLVKLGKVAAKKMR